jgi:hypothetical protein
MCCARLLNAKRATRADDGLRRLALNSDISAA